MTRQTRTPRERAEEALAVADRAVARLETKRDNRLAAARAVESEIREAVRRRDYLAQSPDLPSAPVALTVSDTTTEEQDA